MFGWAGRPSFRAVVGIQYNTILYGNPTSFIAAPSPPPPPPPPPPALSLRRASLWLAVGKQLP